MTLRLRVRRSSPIPIEASVIAPNRLASLSLVQIEKLTLRHGNRATELAEWLDVSGDPSDGNTEIAGDCNHFWRLGQGMNGGSLSIQGSAGMYLGAEMTGGRIDVTGSASDGAGSCMRGGIIHICLDAGAYLGGPPDDFGLAMRGGTIIVEGAAGNGAGCRMRRGTIAIAGCAGSHAAAGSRGGSIFIGGTVGNRAGLGMIRGSIIVLGAAPELLPTFSPDGCFRPIFLGVYARFLESMGMRSLDKLRSGGFACFRGDLASGGRGELLYWQPPVSIE